MDLSIVIPVYNEEDNVAPLWAEIVAALRDREGTWEAIFVDDGSRDRSVERLQLAAGDDARAVIVRLARNYGQSAAMAAGFERAAGRVIVPLDGDRQNDPAEISRVVAGLSRDVDVVCGWRRDRHDAWLRSFVSRQANRLISRVTGVALHDYGCTLKAFKAEFLKPIPVYGEMHRFLPVFARWEGARISEMAVNHRPRVAGTSKYGLDRTFRVMLDLVLVQFLTKYRGRAMRFFGRWIWGMAFLSAGSLAAALMSALGAPWGGGVWLLLAVLFGLGAVSILCCGLMAELLWRTYYESRGARPYSVAEVISARSARDADEVVRPFSAARS